MTLTRADTHQILAALLAADWDEAVVTVAGLRIAVARGGAPLTGPATPVAAPAAVAAPVPGAPAPVAAGAGTGAPAPPGAGATSARAPSVGVFRRGPSPDAPPFVEVGARVEQGETLGIVEVTRLVYEVPAPCGGVVLEVLVEDAEPVEFGDVLVTLQPAPV